MNDKIRGHGKAGEEAYHSRLGVAYGSGGACGVGQNLSIRLPHVSNGRNTAKWIWRGVAGCWPTSRSLWWKGISLRVADDPLHGPDKRHGVREDLGGTLAVSVTGTLRDRCFLCKKTPHHPQVAVVSLRYSQRGHLAWIRIRERARC